MKYVRPLIVVKDVNVSRKFYENLLGQRVKYDFGENVVFEGEFSIHLEEHYKKLLGEKDNKIIKGYSSFELYFETDELDSTLERLKENKVEFLHETREQPWGQRVMRFYDPDHHTIEVGETLESVVLRYYKSGMGVEDISSRTSMPKEFVKNTIGSKVKQANTASTPI
jgi:Lactoylglutathione lyase and related lyases